MQAGGRTRVSGITCALAIASYVTFGAGFIERVPIAALVGTMLCLVLDIFDWTSFARIRKIPKTDAAVLVLVTGVTVVTNLAVAVFAGVVLSALGYAYKSSQRIEARRTSVPVKTNSVEYTTVYEISGPLFFGSVGSFTEQLDPKTEGNDRVVLDFASSKVWDSSALVAIDDVAETNHELRATANLSSVCRRAVVVTNAVADAPGISQAETSHALLATRAHTPT